MTDTTCVVRKSGGPPLACARSPDQVQRLEGNWYFHPDCVDTAVLEVSRRTYTCPEKGTCYWVDLKTDRGYVNDVAWVYPDTPPPYHRIRGWYGFYPGHRIYSISSGEAEP